VGKMVKKLPKAEKKQTTKKEEEIQLFDPMLLAAKGNSEKNYTNCYCYGPAYPPCS